jgi:alkanesulfonate monooxygenase SsuD/methylene tetrahydromethanopterin reductase-like flavin-dependent oxidoreductase (luciferase family)
MRYGISIAGVSLQNHGRFAKMAEDAGFELVVTNDNRGNSDTFVKMTAMALATKTIQVGSGICRAFVRTPIATGTAAMTLDELCGGRVVLCLGGGTRRQIDYGIEIEHGAPQLKEVIEIMRLLWATHPRLFEYNGRFYQLKGDAPGARRNLGVPTGRRIPIYIACVREAAIRMMGEVADGSAGHPDWHPLFIDKVVLPNLEIGLKRAGRTRQDFDLSCWRICHIVGNGVDRQTARRRAAREIGGYLQVRSYSSLLDSAGWEKEKAAIYHAALELRDMDALIDAVTDEIIDAIALVGTPDEVRKKAAAYEGVLDRIILHGGDEDNHRAMMEVFAPNA